MHEVRLFTLNANDHIRVLRDCNLALVKSIAGVIVDMVEECGTDFHLSTLVHLVHLGQAIWPSIYPEMSCNGQEPLSAFTALLILSETRRYRKNKQKTLLAIQYLLGSSVSPVWL